MSEETESSTQVKNGTHREQRPARRRQRYHDDEIPLNRGTDSPVAVGPSDLVRGVDGRLRRAPAAPADETSQDERDASVVYRSTSRSLEVTDAQLNFISNQYKLQHILREHMI